jgi:DNA-binding LacI/PurR family transcriptional regulator
MMPPPTTSRRRAAPSTSADVESRMRGRQQARQLAAREPTAMIALEDDLALAALATTASRCASLTARQ